MSVWTEEAWAVFFDLLDNGWPGDLDADAGGAYRVLLDGTEPDQVVTGLRRLLHAGARFRPSAAEILAACRRDPARPTWLEAYRLIFGQRGVLRARPGATVFATSEDRRRAYDDAALERAESIHPLVLAFVRLVGVGELRRAPIDDPEYGQVHRRDLERRWKELVERSEERDVALAALPSGERRRSLNRFDPLAVLSAGAPAQLVAGKEEASHDR